MPMQLNNSHPLAGNVKLLIGVESDNTLVDLVTPSRTFSPASGSSFGTGTYGRHFRFGGAQYAPAGATFDAFTPANNTGTLICVVNGVTYAQGDIRNRQYIIGRNNVSNNGLLPEIIRGPNGRIAAQVNDGGGGYTVAEAAAGGSLQAATARMIAVARDGTGAYALFVNGTIEASGTGLGANYTTPFYDKLGGVVDQSAINADLVWAVWLDVVLTETELDGLYASLGADNAFDLVLNGTAPQGTVTISAVDPGSITAEAAYSYSDTDEDSFEARLDGGTPFAIGASPAAITGLSPATNYDLEIRAVNAFGNGNWSTPFEFTTYTLHGFDFDTDPDCIFGEIVGSLTGIALEAAATDYIVRAYDPATGALIEESGTLSIGSTGRLPRWEDVAFAEATEYHLVFVRVADGKIACKAMTTT